MAEDNTVHLPSRSPQSFVNQDARRCLIELDLVSSRGSYRRKEVKLHRWRRDRPFLQLLDTNLNLSRFGFGICRILLPKLTLIVTLCG
jgi:hypothetical protein